MTSLRRGVAGLWTRVRTVPPWLILAAGFGGFLAYGFPGLMSSDSVHQLWEARTRVYSNPHPPFMAAQWTVLDALISGPLLMLLLQGTLFLYGVHGLARQAMGPRAAALAAVGILLFPPVMVTLAVIWKDSQMAAYLVAGAAAILSPRRRVRLVGLALICAGCAFRHNAFAAAVPLVGLLFVWRPGQAWWQRYLVSGAAAIAAVGLAMVVNRALTVERAHLSPAYADIVGVLAFSDDRTDDDLRHVLRGTPLVVTTDIQAAARRIYDPRNSFLVTRGDGRMFEGEATPAQQQALERAWRELVTGEWRAYLAHRTAMFAELLGLSEAGLWGPVYFGFVEFADHPDVVEHDATPSTVQVAIFERLVGLANHTVLFRPYLYVALALVMMIAFSRDRVSFAILFSGLLYELSFFPAGGTPDCRYSHWMVTCTCLATVILFAQRLARGAAARPAR